MTNTEYIRAHALAWVDAGPAPAPCDSLENLLKTEWDENFERLMRSHLIMGAFRYCKYKNPEKGYPYRDNIPRFRMKIAEWFDTKNNELLVDIANYCMILFTYPVEGSYFKAQDDHHEPEGI
jgi:hypothetical protein